jgi:serine/threonine protein kinase
MQNPTINGRYRILQQIGVGGFGLTYLAEDVRLPTRPKTVVKHLRPQITDAETLELANRLFQQEAEILYRLGGHPNIPSLIAHFKEKGEFFLVQEYVEGHTLDREFQGGRRYNQKEIIQFLGQTLEILAFVHSQKVIHRDVKPANLIRRSADGNIFLIDFGAVKKVGAAPRAPEANASMASVTIGSHGYMPMEQMAGNPNFSSDLYALGLIAIEALTGIKPSALPRSGAPHEFEWANRAQLSPDLERFISKLVRTDFRQRFVSGGEALTAFDRIAANVGFFSSRRQPVSSVMTVPPILAGQTFQPVVPPGQSFVPPTVIVPTNAASPQGYPAAFQNSRTVAVRKSSGTTVAVCITGVVFFIGFLFLAGKVLNFPWHSLNEREVEPPQSARREPGKTSEDSGLSLLDEALKQAQEAAEIERRATTRFEWEQIGNKYKRASALLASIEASSPDYAAAREKIDIFKSKADAAFEKMKNFSD